MIGTARGFAMQRCSGCRTIYTDHLPAGTEAKDYENWEYYSGGLDVPDFVLERLKHIASGFDSYRSELNTWLDVGCGAGTLMRAAGTLGWRVIGTEVAPAAAEAVRSAGLDVRVGELGALPLEPAGFDVVSLVEVVEHVPDPAALLTEAARLVRPGGAVYLTTPHARGISARLLGTRWSVVAPPEHLQLFSASGITAVLRGAGLEVRSLRTHAVNPYELMRAVRPRAGAAPFRTTETSYRLNEALSSNRTGSVAKGVANAVLSTLSLGDSLKVVAVRPDQPSTAAIQR
jgi:SAM-dependent methyltransferase